MSNSNTESNILIKEIKCPELNQVGFAYDLESAFNKINDNFSQLANYDFVKSNINSPFVKIESVPIYEQEGEDEGKITNSLCKELKTFIKSLLENQSDSIVVGNRKFNYFDNFTKDTAGYLHIIYGNIGNNIKSELIPFSTLQYVFLDGRFWNNDIGKIDAINYKDIHDISCIIVYDKDNGFKCLNNAFPTIYYEENVGLCWKINGKNTGITIQGLPGGDGSLNYNQWKAIYSDQNKKSENKTLICNDGIIIKHNNEVIGLGMGDAKNETELKAELYYSYNDSTANGKKITKTIALEDLFKKFE